MLVNGGKFGDGIVWGDCPLPSSEAWAYREMVDRQDKHTDGPPWLHEPDVDMLVPTEANGENSFYEAYLKARDVFSKGLMVARLLRLYGPEGWSD